MRHFYLPVLFIFFAGNLWSQHLGLEGGFNISQDYSTPAGTSWNAGITYEHELLPWLHISTGALYTDISLSVNDVFCKPESGHPCPIRSNGPISILEIPLFLHFKIFGNEKGTWSMWPVIGYGYGLSFGHYTQAVFDETAPFNYAFREVDIPNVHIGSIGLESRHYLTGNTTLSYGFRYRYMTEVTTVRQPHLEIDNYALYLKIGLDLSK